MQAADRWDRLLTVLFLLVVTLFVAAAVTLAAVNGSPGSPDSLNNLETARSLARGEGFRTRIVQQHFVQVPVPGPETLRPPGAPFVIAAAFRLFGISMAIPVLLNGALVALSAFLVRRAIRSSGAPRIGDLAGILLLLSGNFHLISVWNNNYLLLCTTGLLALGPLRERDRCSPWVLAAACGVIGAIGFLMKPTFVISAVPFAAFLLFLAEGSPFRRRTLPFVLFLVLFAALTSPYWIWSLDRFGRPIHSQASILRLSERYGGLPHKTWWTVRFDRPVTYREMAEIHGTLELARKEVSRWLRAMVRIFRLNPPVALLAAPGLYFLMRSSRWRRYAIPVILWAEPLFSGGLYARPDKRYFWPVFPCVLYMAGLVARDLIERRDAPLPAGPARRWRQVAIILLGCGLVFGLYRTQRTWRRYAAESSRPAPAWTDIIRAVPDDAVFLTDDPWSVAWVADRPAVICPGGERPDLIEVVKRYRPDYYFHAGRGYGDGLPAFQDGDLEPMPGGTAEGQPWAFYRLKMD